MWFGYGISPKFAISVEITALLAARHVDRFLGVIEHVLQAARIVNSLHTEPRPLAKLCPGIAFPKTRVCVDQPFCQRGE